MNKQRNEEEMKHNFRQTDIETFIVFIFKISTVSGVEAIVQVFQFLEVSSIYYYV